ncbi:autotransporter assembly complex protein TamA [Saccharospirillum salsuginis]|uniref:Outer membrane protein assembly factor n=1 Tax=Saccharospirillum salsuginis TaxID=418750 RepID=A0A918K1S6_9GAMM|nr:BamA/TamA family outer membrane protein [Saccharospirillum salsuginis]GGX43346.1 outer membrane protein assembly factor [Saccharospirillum salsuginis]
MKAEETAGLPPVLKNNLIVEPGNRALHRALIAQLEQYRESLGSINLSPNLSRLSRGEIERMRQVLDSHGFYDADIIYRTVPESQVDYTFFESTIRLFTGAQYDGEHIQYRIDTGEQYKVLSVTIDGVDIETPETWPLAGVGEPMVAETILADQSQLRAIIDDKGCYFTLEVTHQVRLAEAEHGGHLVYRVLANQPSKVGDITFSGTEGVSERFLRRQTDLDDGACFSRADIDQAVLNLYQTQLFATVRRSLTRTEEGRVDARFDLVQRPPRTVRAGVGWDTDQGFGLKLGWEHRNMWGRAQRLTLGTELWAERQSANAQITLPGFLEARNTLVWNNTVSHETPEDKEYYSGESRATINRQASREDTYRYGIAYERIDEKVNDKWNTFSLLRFPLAYEYDENPNSLNPRRGVRYNVQTEPVFSLSGSSDPFFVGTLGWASYRPLGDDVVLANRLEWTSLWPLTDTADLDRIPDSERLVSGGGGSVRGYPYRSIGVDGTSEGGTQKWEGALELRAQMGQNWGVALFTDVASVSEEWNPTRDQDWFTGIGMGVRYYTALAPIRFDVAIPMNRRDSDAAFQIYLSLGQAF